MLVQLQDDASPRTGGTAAAPALPQHHSSLAGTATPALPLYRSSLAGSTAAGAAAHAPSQHRSSLAGTAAAAGTVAPSSPNHRSSLADNAAVGTAAASFPGGIRPGRGAGAVPAPGIGDGTRVQPWWVAAGFSAAPAMLKRYADLLREREEVMGREVGGDAV